MKVYIYEENNDTIIDVIRTVRCMRGLKAAPKIYLITRFSKVWEESLKLPVTGVIKKSRHDPGDGISYFDKFLDRSKQ